MPKVKGNNSRRSGNPIHPQQNTEGLGTSEESSSTRLQCQDIVPNLVGIEKESITDNSGSTYIPEKFEKCFIAESEEAKKLKLITLRFLLAKKKYPNRNPKLNKPSKLYMISKAWYEEWLKFSKYKTMKRIIKSYNTYEDRPIMYKPENLKNPGKIKNEDLLIRNKIGKDERNILASKDSICLDTKLNFKKNVKLLTKERFDLLNDYFKSDIVLKVNKKKIMENECYDNCCAHFKLVLLPSLTSIKTISEENFEAFCNSHKIVYDIYFKQTWEEREFQNEFYKILEENPQLLQNMGIELKDNKISKNNFQFYIPDSKNTKTLDELMDTIYNMKTIEKLNKGEKIKEDEINITNVPYFNFCQIYNPPRVMLQEHINEFQNGIFFFEYLTENDPETRNLCSIFDIKNIVKSVVIHCDNSSYHNYKLESLPLDEKDNKNGLVGLNNLGNTCYMNTGLQCLSNCDILTEYILKEYYMPFINKENPIGSKGEVIEKYSELIHHLWWGKEGCIPPIEFKSAFGKMHTAFNNYNQQDTQEFISYLLDTLHEDLNKVKDKPYTEVKDLSDSIPDEELYKITKNIYLKRNQSFIVDVFTGFYKSTLFCPFESCKYIRKSFEPFNMITLSLVNEAEMRKLEEYQNELNKQKGFRTIQVTFFSFKLGNPIKFPIKVKKDMDIFEFKKKIEAISGLNKNTFEIYKKQSSEYTPIKPDIYILEDFLKGENQIFLFQLPPYVFSKPLDFFDKQITKLCYNPDKLFLEEEKYEGNDLYKEYNMKGKKSKTDDDINTDKKMNIEEGNNGPKKPKDDMDIKAKKDINDKVENKIEEDTDTIMSADTLNWDRKSWVKIEIYNYSFANENKKDKKGKEIRIGNTKILYVNKNCDNAQLYQYIFEMLGNKIIETEDEQKAIMENLSEGTKKLQKIQSKKQNLIEEFNNMGDQIFMLEYLSCYNYNKTNIMQKKEGWKNLIFPFNSEKHTINSIVDAALQKNNVIEDIELLFKITWKPLVIPKFEEINKAIEICKSSKLDEIFQNLIVKEISKKTKKEEKNEKNEKKCINLEDLLKNFSETEKLTSDNQWFCPKCKDFRLADKKMEIYSINEIVIIHLKRFRNNKKIDKLVNFPIEDLDLGKYLSNNKESYIYDLFAVANHSGGLHGGHYYAYCKNSKEGEWFEFNDSNVNIIETKKIVSSNAYVLFYKRRRNDKDVLDKEKLFKKEFVKID